jgi:hypothetical protein
VSFKGLPNIVAGGPAKTIHALIQFRDFTIQVRQGGFERLTMMGMRRGFEFMHDAHARKLQVLLFLFLADLRVGLISGIGIGFGYFRGLYLGFHVFAFPSTRHMLILPQFTTQRGNFEGQFFEENFRLSAGCAALRNHRERRAHHALHGAFGHARQMLGKDAAIREFRAVIGPMQPQIPDSCGEFGAGER